MREKRNLAGRSENGHEYALRVRLSSVAAARLVAGH
jgi:hypothetical protein